MSVRCRRWQPVTGKETQLFRLCKNIIISQYYLPSTAMHLSALGKSLKNTVAAEIGLFYVWPLTNSHFHFVSSTKCGNEVWWRHQLSAIMLKNEDNLSYVELCTQSDTRHGTEHTEHPSQPIFTTSAIRTTAEGTGSRLSCTAAIHGRSAHINIHPTTRRTVPPNNLPPPPFPLLQNCIWFPLQVYRQEVIGAVNGAYI